MSFPPSSGNPMVLRENDEVVCDENGIDTSTVAKKHVDMAFVRTSHGSSSRNLGHQFLFDTSTSSETLASDSVPSLNDGSSGGVVAVEAAVGYAGRVRNNQQREGQKRSFTVIGLSKSSRTNKQRFRVGLRGLLMNAWTWKEPDFEMTTSEYETFVRDSFLGYWNMG